MKENDEPLESRILNDVARMNAWMAKCMLRATPFFLVAGGLVALLGKFWVNFIWAVLMWFFVMGVLFLKDIWMRKAALLVTRLARWRQSLEK